ncbi:3-[(3aS,4S,7aS)-7a-methyl-1,5-dioxo-octahydro-1H-inden-4-yl]propanoyl:CoA ligase-like [Haliotis cracherodii]|uniref:3-[(3aS,4S,7aS)-7a-methyl-1, 5-dioxo-octahydro-1H-inden-4-yl]propanoyl:CoA ligase-like n=1 Tax=Haliotis cracherodii TaxID=6455 RepID=UPI0039E8DF01
MEEACKDQTIADRIKLWGETDPHTPAFIFWSPNGRFILSRGDVLDLSRRFSSRLTQKGVQPGDVVCVSLPNSPERVVVDFGVQLTGAVSMNGQILRSDGQDIIESMRKAKCKVLVIDPDEGNDAWNICRKHVHIESEDRHMPIATSVEVPTLANIAFCRTRKPESLFLKTLLSIETSIMNIPKHKPTDVAYIFATSGTSGYSKLVQHTHRSLMVICFRLTEDTGMKDKHSKSFISGPLGWIGGFPVYYLYSGCPQVLIDDTAEAVSDRLQFIWDVACKEDIQVSTLAPFQFMGILGRRDIWESSGKKLPMIVTGGQPLHREYLDTIGQLTESIFCLYASTEVGYVAGIGFRESNLSLFKENMAGVLASGVEAKIVDSNMASVAENTRGEILIRSETITAGYVDVPDKHQAFLSDGWFRTDDIGFIDGKGCLIVEGRSSDAIMHGQYILYPTWLEEKLARCSGIKQNYIVPVPDKVMHHEICACVQLEEGARLTEEDVITFVRGDVAETVRSDMNVVPKYVLFFDSFPVTKTLKLDRKELTRFAQKRLQLE